MTRKHLYNFNATTDTGIDTVPLNSIISIEDVGGGKPELILYTDSTNITGATTIAQLLALTAQWEKLSTGELKNLDDVDPSLAPTDRQFLRYDSVTSTWIADDNAAVGSVGNNIFYENEKIITDSYTISTNHNAMTAGPVTIGVGGKTITSIDGTATQILVTATAHGLVAGNKVNITATTNYNGNYTVASVTNANDYIITDALHDLAAETSGTSTKEVIVTIPDGSTWTIV